MDAIGDGIWYARGADFPLPGGARMPLGSTVLQLGDGSLLIYAPIAFSEADAAAIDAAGAVAHVVAPNLLHHLFAADALRRWPRAAFHGPAALAKKRPDLPPAQPLAIEGALAAAVDAVQLDGAPAVDETVLFHRASRTLLCGDLLFNLGAPANLASRIVFTLMGVNGRLAQSRAWRFSARIPRRCAPRSIACWRGRSRSWRRVTATRWR